MVPLPPVVVLVNLIVAGALQPIGGAAVKSGAKLEAMTLINAVFENEL